MAPPTVAQVKARISTMCAQIEGIKTVVDSYPSDRQPFDPSELPAIIVRVSYRATNTRESAGGYLMTMDYILELNVQRSANDARMVDEAALEATEPYITRIPAYFGARRRLEYNDNGLATGCEIPQLVASARSIRDGAVYARLFFRMAVTTRHTF